MKLDYIALFLILFFLTACGSKPSSPDMMDDNALPTEETFKDIDLANNLKDCGKPLLLSDIYQLDIVCRCYLVNYLFCVSMMH